jgi:16S rRNA (uracil1498-N3)-methyltransferase
MQAAAVAGFVGIRLGPRILRTETAGLAALAAMQCLWGDFREEAGMKAKMGADHV